MALIDGSIRVLHVDDEPEFADMVATFLQRADDRLEIETATGASEGLDRLTAGDFDCIVSDYDMPGQNGIEFLESVRDRYPDLPFILYTGKGSEAVASEAISAGTTDYLQKHGTETEQYELLANRITNAVEQYQASRRAAKLDRIHTLASDINRALVRAESRSDVETQVCEILSDADPYHCAWIGDVDRESYRIIPRTTAGVGDDYPEAVTITADGTATGQGPCGTAVRDRQVAVSNAIAEDPAFEPWRDAALERDFEAMAAIPLEYQDAFYGVLAVCANRAGAFGTADQELLTELGNDIADTLHALDVRHRLRNERDRRRALFENAPGPVIASKLDEECEEIVIADVNEAFEEVFGYDRTEVLGKDPADVVVPDDQMGEHEEIRTRAGAGETVVTEVERLTVDGPRTFLLNIIPFGGDEHVDGLYAWYTDITSRERREETIADLHSTVRELMEGESAERVAEIAVKAVADVLDMPANAIHLYDEDEAALPPVAWTEYARELVDEIPTYRPGESLAWEVFETGEPQIHDDVSTVPGRHNPDTSVGSEMLLPLGDHGVLIVGAEESSAFDDIDVSLARTLAADVTTALDRLDREHQLTVMEEIVQGMNDGAVIAQDGVLQYANPQIGELVGYEPAELVGESMGRFIAPEYRDVVKERHRERLSGQDDALPEQYEIEISAASGEQVPVEITVSRIEYDGEPATISIVRDISERKSQQRQTKQIRERLLFALEATNSNVWVTDLETGTADVYGTMKAFFDPSDIDKFADFISTVVHPEDREDIEASYRAIEDGDAEELTAEFRTDPALGDVRWFRSEGYVATIDENRTLIGLTTDVTERKERERALVRQNERLDRFASVVSHDLRNPLKVASGRLELAREECDSDHLDGVADAHDRMDSLIDDLLTVARQGADVAETEPVALESLVHTCWETVSSEGATVVVETTLTVLAESDRLQRLLENLFRNALEHGGESVTVTVGQLSDRDGFYVADDGPGIPEDERVDVFEPGYSTTETGTGFGLEIVRNIAEAHGWTVSVTDSADGGARFEVSGVEFQ